MGRDVVVFTTVMTVGPRVKGDQGSIGNGIKVAAVGVGKNWTWWSARMECHAWRKEAVGTRPEFMLFWRIDLG